MFYSNSFFKPLVWQKIFCITTLLLIKQNCFSQENNFILDSIVNKESFSKLADSIIINEVSFVKKKRLGINSDGIYSKLNEISLINCTDSFAYFSKGPFIVSIESEMISKKRIKRVSYIFHKYQVLLPDSALTGLYEPNFCSKSNNGNFTQYCKVYITPDNRRVYIYMLNGKGGDSYEVTWIIQDDKYYKRIVDKVND